MWYTQVLEDQALQIANFNIDNSPCSSEDHWMKYILRAYYIELDLLSTLSKGSRDFISLTSLGSIFTWKTWIVNDFHHYNFFYWSIQCPQTYPLFHYVQSKLLRDSRKRCPDVSLHIPNNYPKSLVCQSHAVSTRWNLDWVCSKVVGKKIKTSMPTCYRPSCIEQ